MSNTVATIRKDSPSPSERPEATPANSSLQTIIVERRDRVGLITLNRPKSLNALNGQMAIETLAALKAFDADDQVGAVVITGSARAFAAGADIAEMAEKPFTDFYMSDFLAPWDEIRSISKPIIASAVLLLAAAASSRCSAISLLRRRTPSSVSRRSSSASCPVLEVHSG